MPDRSASGRSGRRGHKFQGTHLYIYSQRLDQRNTGNQPRVRAFGSSRLFEYDQTGKYVREIGQGLYGFVFAHAVRIDPQDNIWVMDEGSSMVIEFDPEGKVIMTMGRKPEAITVPSMPPLGMAPTAARGRRPAGSNTGAGAPGDSFRRPTDVAWDSAGNIFVADGYDNSRVAKFDKDGKYIKSWGQRGTEPGEFHTVALHRDDAKDNVYVGDRENKRIQVFDNDGNFKTEYLNVGAPWAICITPGAHQYMY